MADFHVNDIGTVLKITVKDQDGAVVQLDETYLLTISFQKPDGSTTDRTASLFSDGSDGIIQYITQAGDLDQSGTWRFQAVVVKQSGETIVERWHSDATRFKVVANLES